MGNIAACTRTRFRPHKQHDVRADAHVFSDAERGGIRCRTWKRKKKRSLKARAALFSHLSPCHAEVDCGHPGTPPHAAMSGEKFTSGSTVRFSCSGERQLMGDSSLSCQLSGHWSAPLPHCSGAQTHKQMGSSRRPDTQPRASS